MTNIVAGYTFRTARLYAKVYEGGLLIGEIDELPTESGRVIMWPVHGQPYFIEIDIDRDRVVGKVGA